MPASSGRRFALEISADLNRLATDRKHSQAKANAQSNDDDLAAAVTRRDHDTLFLDTISKLKDATGGSVFVEQQPVADTVLHGLASGEASAE